MSRSLVIKATSGMSDGAERCNQAFTVAAAAVASGLEVSLWLTGEAAWYGRPGRAAELKLEHATPLPDLLAVILAAGRAAHWVQTVTRPDARMTSSRSGSGVACSSLSS